MEKNQTEPEFITREENGVSVLEVVIPEGLREKIKEEVRQISGAIIVPN